ncbi:MAG: TraR/DksA family transcriptional regulator [bacterium]
MERKTGKKKLREILFLKKGVIQEKITEELGEKTSENMRNLLGPAINMADMSSLDVERDIDYKILRIHSENLKRVDEALVKLEEGSYGVCKECGGSISEKRLIAIPFTSYCIECQRKREREESLGSEREETEMIRYTKNELGLATKEDKENDYYDYEIDEDEYD